jgi:glycine/D-amino acid oxidase-like deaminating enzyme
MTAPSASAKQDYYEATPASTGYAAPAGASEHAICIVGGGFGGLATAMSLLERGVRDVVLLEAERIGHGASGRNGGFVFGGYSLGEDQLCKQVGVIEARALYGFSVDAVATIGRRIEQHRIDCAPVHAGVLLADWFHDGAALDRRRRFMLEQMGAEWHPVPAATLAELLLTERYGAALFEPGAFHFNPLQYARGLARVLHEAGVAVHENARVTRLERAGTGWRIETAGAVLHARELVLCCGGYLDGLQPVLGRAMLPIATYVMVTEPLEAHMAAVMRTRAAVYDTRFAFDYYRPLPDSRLLWGGRIGVRPRGRADIMRLLRADMLRVYPQLAGVRIEHAWSGAMSYGRHQMPQLGRLPDGTWYAMGFGGHGVGPTTVAGEALAAALTGDGAMLARFARWGLPRTGGGAGLAAAQLSYWGRQGLDWARAAKKKWPPW